MRCLELAAGLSVTKDTGKIVESANTFEGFVSGRGPTLAQAAIEALGAALNGGARA